ncbi:MAG TPA: FAD-binding oxidoreductase, partial [Edaphobacter sp.]|nr:FAD-binding oxidoreductase [Edaphobacter sp.]
MLDSTSSQTFADDLAAISGPEHLRVDENTFSIAPVSTEEIAAVLRYANRNGITIATYGGGTKQNWGNPIHPSLMLHTHRLGSVREHTWQDMTCTVQAGCLWSSMQQSLAKHGQFVALDPLWPDRATIGGIAATNDSGSLRLRYGSLRDLIIGMTIVLADGTIARSGGKVVKNVAGYDLHKLMTGAFGTLGIITEITFRLHSIPRHVQSFTIASFDVESLGQLLMKILDSHLSTQSLQLRSGSSGFALDVRLATLPAVIRDQASSLSKLAQSVQLEASDSDSDVWDTRQEHFDRTEYFVMKATMLPSDISPIAATIRTLGGTSVTQAAGIMTASIPAAAPGQLEHLREKLEAIGGSLTVLHHPADAIPVASTTPSDTIPLMRELKNRFDPNRVLNPGR